MLFNGRAASYINDDGYLIMSVRYLSRERFSSAISKSRLLELEPEIRFHPNFTRGERIDGFGNLSVSSGLYEGGDIAATHGARTHEFHGNTRQSAAVVIIFRDSDDAIYRIIVINNRTYEDTRALQRSLLQMQSDT